MFSDQETIYREEINVEDFNKLIENREISKVQRTRIYQ